MGVRTSLLEMLIEHASLSPAEIEHAIRLQQERGGVLAEIFICEGILPEQDFFFLMSRHLGASVIPEERLLHLTLSPEIQKRVPRSLAQTHVLIPFDLDVEAGVLSVAMLDPSDRNTLELLRKTSRVTDIRAYLARRSTILNAMEMAYTLEEGDLENGSLEELPLLGPAQNPGDSEAKKYLKKQPPVFEEAKVEIDPQLAEEIAALSTQADLARSAKSKRVGARKGTTDHGGHNDNVSFNELDSYDIDTPITPMSPLPSITPPHEVRGRSLFHNHVAVDSLKTTAYNINDTVERTEEMDFRALEMEYDTSLEVELLEVTPPVLVDRFPSPAHPDTADTLEEEAFYKELLSSVGILVAMLEERIDSSGGSYREYGRLCRLVAREQGIEEPAISRIALAAHLYGLDIALKREVGITVQQDITEVFSAQSTTPGGLGPSLRLLGAKALGLYEEQDALLPGVSLIRLVVDYLNLCDESDSELHDLETVTQLLRTGGGDPIQIDALIRAVESLKLHQQNSPMDSTK